MVKDTIVVGMKEELKRLSEKGGMEHFQAAYNNEPKYRRVKNRRPRTDLMVKGVREITDYDERGFIPHAMEYADESLAEHPEDDKWPHCDGYVDVVYGKGGWFAGKTCWGWIAEVENEFEEFKGTISDLLRFQAKRKLGVFYHQNLDDAEKVGKFQVAFQAFVDAGFCESPDTRYEILILPGKLEIGLLDTEILYVDFLHREYRNARWERKRLADL